MKQWRVSWEMWPHKWPTSARTEKIYDNYAEALSHLKGLRSMLADHPPRPCNDHVWNIQFEERETGEWRVTDGPA